MREVRLDGADLREGLQRDFPAVLPILPQVRATLPEETHHADSPWGRQGLSGGKLPQALP